MKRWLLATVLLLSVGMQAQVGYGTAKRIRYGTSLPTSCDPSVGEVAFKTAAPNIGLYLCTATDTYTQVTTTSAAGITSLNGLTPTTQTLAVPGTIGTAPNWVSSVSTHTLNIPMASAVGVTGGLLSKADYDVFNGKAAVLGGPCSNQFVRNITSSAVTCDGIAQADLPVVGVAKGGLNLTVATNNATPIGDGAAWLAVVWPSCSNGVTDKLLYNNGTHVISCGVDQGGGGSGYTTIQQAGGALTQRTTLNVNDTLLVASDTGALTQLAMTSLGKTRVCGFILGADDGPVLVDTNDQASICANRWGSTWTLTEVWCETDQGSSSINLQRDDGTAANILTSNLTCPTTGATGTLDGTEKLVANTDRVDLVLVTAAVSGTPKRITVWISGTI